MPGVPALRPDVPPQVRRDRAAAAALESGGQPVARLVGERVGGKQFDELAAFSQFASDLDAATQAQLARGKRLRELLKQPQFSPLNLAEQVAIVYAGVKGLIDDVPVDKVTEFARELREYLKSNKPDFITKVMGEKQLSDESEAMLKDAIKEVTSTMLAAA